MNTKSVETLISEAYKNACEHGFHDEKKSVMHFLALTAGEIGEITEADRKSKRANLEEYFRCLGYGVTDEDFDKYIKDTVEDEMADVCIRLFDICGCFGYRIRVVEDKVAEHSYEKFSMTENAWILLLKLTDVECDIEERIENALCFVIGWAVYLKVDLGRHIDLKMEYNKRRVKMHGKKY